MDCETIKLLILEKLFNVFVPKLFNYYSILDSKKNEYSWGPNFNLLAEPHRINYLNTIHFTILGNKTLEIFKIHFSKINNQQRVYNQNRRMADLYVRHVYDQPVVGNVIEENIQLEFENKQIAIKEICKHVDLNYLIKVGMCAINEIKNHDSNDCMSIGAIKTILDINPEVNLYNLETRKILIEKHN
jgi:hypothetical protein